MPTAVEAGQAGQGIADAAVLAWAHALGRAVLTHHRKHFRILPNAGHAHSGLVLCTEDADFAALGPGSLRRWPARVTRRDN